MSSIKVKGAPNGRLRVSPGNKSGRLRSVAQAAPSGAPLVYPPSAYNSYQVSLMRDGSVGPKLMFYGGYFGYKSFSPPLNFTPYGYVYDVDTPGWSPGLQFGGPAEDAGLGRFVGIGASLITNNKTMVVGGVSATPTLSYIILHSGSSVYDAGTDSWTAESSIPNYTGGIFQPAAAVDPVDNKVFVMSKQLTIPPVSVTWLDQLSVCENPTDPTPVWSAIETSTALDLTNAYADGFGVIMSARHAGSYTQLMVVTGSNNSSPRGDTMGVFLWDQTQTGPISGSWTYVTGSDSAGGMGIGTNTNEPAALPRPSSNNVYTQFWDNLKSRWTFIDNDYYAAQGLWWTWDGATWDSGTFDRSGFLPVGPDPQYTNFSSLIPDPVNSCVYGAIIVSGSNESNRTWIDNSVWFLNLPTDLSTAAWTKLSD